MWTLTFFLFSLATLLLPTAAGPLAIRQAPIYHNPADDMTDVSALDQSVFWANILIIAFHH